jgi:hypothetical protein
MVKFELSWLKHRLDTIKGYSLPKDVVDTAFIAKDIRQKLIDGGLDLADFLMDGIQFIIT